MSNEQHAVNRLSFVRQLLERGLVIQADRELDNIINELWVQAKDKRKEHDNG